MKYIWTWRKQQQASLLHLWQKYWKYLKFGLNSYTNIVFFVWIYAWAVKLITCLRSFHLTCVHACVRVCPLFCDFSTLGPCELMLSIWCPSSVVHGTCKFLLNLPVYFNKTDRVFGWYCLENMSHSPAYFDIWQSLLKIYIS